LKNEALKKNLFTQILNGININSLVNF